MKILTTFEYMRLPNTGAYLVWMDVGVALFNDDVKGAQGVEYLPKCWYFIDKEEDGTT